MDKLELIAAVFSPFADDGELALDKVDQQIERVDAGSGRVQCLPSGKLDFELGTFRAKHGQGAGDTCRFEARQ